MLDKDGKYEIHLTPELVGYISEMMAEEKYCGYDTSEFVEKITQGKFN